MLIIFAKILIYRSYNRCFIDNTTAWTTLLDFRMLIVQFIVYRFFLLSTLPLLRQPIAFISLLQTLYLPMPSYFTHSVIPLSSFYCDLFVLSLICWLHFLPFLWMTKAFLLSFAAKRSKQNDVTASKPTSLHWETEIHATCTYLSSEKFDRQWCIWFIR